MRVFLALTAVLLISSCDKENANTSSHEERKISPFYITIDWVPSPEYYGYFVSQKKGFYRESGLDVTITNGTGAPVVANQVAANSIYAGTTTSDNILRQIALGGEYYKAVPILKFNPSVLIANQKSNIKNFSEIDGKNIGVNKQSSVYQQFQYILNKNNAKTVKFNEIPIGWGGGLQLETNQVDCILAYATNVAIDLKIKNFPVNEIFFSDYGVHSFGQVIVFSSLAQLKSKGISTEMVDNFIAATLRGYEYGKLHPSEAADILIETERSLNKQKIEEAIKRIAELNELKPSTIEEIDNWVDGIPSDARKKALTLYK